MLQSTTCGYIKCKSPLIISSFYVQLKRKAPYGECDTAESTGLSMASSGFIQGVGSPRMTPISGNTARKYKSKSECTKAGPQAPTLNAGKYKFVDLVLVTSA